MRFSAFVAGVLLGRERSLAARVRSFALTRVLGLGLRVAQCCRFRIQSLGFRVQHFESNKVLGFRVQGSRF